MSINISAKNLRYSYNNKNVLENINFSIAAGETWAIIGRNGAGKSTLLKCLCGLLAPQKNCGEIFVNERDIKNIEQREIAKIISYVPQGHGRHAPPFTVREYVSMARHPYRNFMAGLTKDDQEVINNALEITDTAHLIGRAMPTLSGGELQSALIAGAVAQDTPFLFLDEPTTFLDPYHQEKIYRALLRVHNTRNAAIITVTHDINFALIAHDNILALVDGKIFFCGSKKDFCDNALDNLCKIFNVNFACANVANNVNEKIYYATGSAS